MSKQHETKKIRWHALITEEDQTRSKKDSPAYKFSIGRVMGWFMFIIMLYMWVISASVPQSLVTAFLTIMAYNLSKKSNFFQDAIDQKTGAEETKE